MAKTDKKYFVFNTVFMVLQIALLICAIIMNLSQGRNMRESILVYVIIEQLCFVECYSIMVGGLSYIKNGRMSYYGWSLWELLHQFPLCCIPVSQNSLFGQKASLSQKHFMWKFRALDF